MMSNNHVTDVGKMGVNQFSDAFGNVYTDDHAGDEKTVFNIEDHKFYDAAASLGKRRIGVLDTKYEEFSIKVNDKSSLLLLVKEDVIALAKHFELTPDDLKG